MAAANGRSSRLESSTTTPYGRRTARPSSSRQSAAAPRICIASGRMAAAWSGSPTARPTTIRPRSRRMAGSLVFVTTRGGGTADLWTMDVQSRTAKALTSGPGGDFRPSWSPDGQWIAFSSDRLSDLPFAHGRWEHLHLVDLFIVASGRIGAETPHGARRLLRQPEVDGRQPARDRLLHDAPSRRSTTAARCPSTPRTRASSPSTSRPA